MSQEKKSTVGDPIWVESVMTPEEYAEAAKKYPSCFSRGNKAVQFDPNYHLGGKWRAGMGKVVPEAERIAYNKGLEKLRELLQTKKFQKRPDYGTHAEAKP